MLISSSRPRAVHTVHNEAMSSQRNAELSSRSQSGGSGLVSPASSRSEPGSTSLLTLNNGYGLVSDMEDDASNTPSAGKQSSTGESIDFRFLNFTHPKDAKNPQTRKNVRSHVTAKQHEKSRKAAAEQARRAQQPSPVYSSSSQVAIDPAHLSESPAPSETSSPEALSSPVASPPTRINPLEIYPEEWHGYVRPVMDHYLHYMGVDIPETDASSREQLRTTYLSIVLTDRAALHALMLTAGAHYNKVRPQAPHKINLLQLRGMAIEEINQALLDHRPGGRATSDQLIAAVGKMATYELLFGQRETFHTHMTGLQRMVSLRGGLQALDRSGLLERILLWLDANAAEISGGALYFPPAAFSSSTGHPRPNRRLFVLGIQPGS